MRSCATYLCLRWLIPPLLDVIASPVGPMSLSFPATSSASMLTLIVFIEDSISSYRVSR